MTKPVKPDDLQPLIGRAYSVLDVKAIKEDQRVIEGIATTPSTDRMGDIIEPLGIEFENPMPLLWQHDRKEPIGHATFAKATKDGIRFRARIAQTDEPGKLKDRLDEAWQSIKIGLVKAVSIGFRPIEFSFMDKGGIHFTKTEVLELSIVTIPANSSASITAIKAIDAASRDQDDFDVEELRKLHDAKQAASGTKQSVTIPAGVTASKATTVVKAKAMKKTIQEQLSSYEATRQAKAARMSEIMEKAADENVTLDEAQSEEYDGLEADIKQIDSHLVRLRRQEEYNKSAAVVVEKVDDAQKASAARAGNGHAVVSVRPNVPKEMGMVRYMIALAKTGGNHFAAADLARSLWPDHREVEISLRTAVNPGTTTDSTWAGPLVVYQNLQNEFAEYLRPLTIIGRINGFRRVPFKIKIPRATGGTTVNWVGEGRVKPVTSMLFDTITMEFYKIAGIVPVTNELIRFSNPSAEAIIRDDLARAIVAFMDQQFVDPSKAANDVSPASITNGVSAITPTGTTAAALRADVKSLMGEFFEASLSMAGGTWIMTQSQATAISLMQTSLGTPEFPGLTPTGGTFLGFPVVASENIPATGGSPVDGYPMIFLVASEIALADDGGVSIDVSREAALQMETTPDSPATASTTLVSLWQHDMTAIKAERFCNWKKIRDASVQYIQNAKYAE
jgi:HK97 family phage major capsid protein/HK97 family phage prohead protease